jgi:hypothetical protein
MKAIPDWIARSTSGDGVSLGTLATSGKARFGCARAELWMGCSPVMVRPAIPRSTSGSSAQPKPRAAELPTLRKVWWSIQQPVQRQVTDPLSFVVEQPGQRITTGVHGPGGVDCHRDADLLARSPRMDARQPTRQRTCPTLSSITQKERDGHVQKRSGAA